MSKAFSVAKELVRLSLAGEEKDPLTNLRLQKLLYYAQGWSLVLRETELFGEEIEAWRCGPVVAEVYRALPGGLGERQIEPEMFPAAEPLDNDDATFVRVVWEFYNQYSALQLSRMTHAEPPWLKAWGDRPANGNGCDAISVDDLLEFFAGQQIPANLGAYRDELRRREEEAQRKLAEMPPLPAAALIAASRSVTPAARRVLAGEG